MKNYEIHIKIDKLLPACINDLIYVCTYVVCILFIFLIAKKNMIYCQKVLQAQSKAEKKGYKINILLVR